VQGFQGEFDALREDSSSPNPAYITFAGGGGTLSFTHEIESAASLELVLDLHTTAQTLETDESNFDLTVSFIDFNWNFNTERDFNEITDDSSTTAVSLPRSRGQWVMRYAAPCHYPHPHTHTHTSPLPAVLSAPPSLTDSQFDCLRTLALHPTTHHLLAFAVRST
jgi:hypothetical protein